MATFAPSLAKRIAIARPIPEEAPVIKMFLPSSLDILVSAPVCQRIGQLQAIRLIRHGLTPPTCTCEILLAPRVIPDAGFQGQPAAGTSRAGRKESAW